MGSSLRAYLHSGFTFVLALSLGAQGSNSISQEEALDTIAPYLADGIRLGGIAGSILLGWRIYSVAVGNAVNIERSATERLSKEFHDFRARAESDYAILNLRLERAEARLVVCNRESADLLKKVAVLEAQLNGDPPTV